MDDRKPHQIIQALYDERAEWTDEAILAELETLPGLPDEDDGPWFGSFGLMWQQEQTLKNADLYLALARHVAKRRLKPGVRLLLERASYGDFGEIMRGLHHTFEAVYGGQYAELANLCAELMQHLRLGTKVWALDQMTRLRDRRAIPELLKAVYEPTDFLFESACMYLSSFYKDFSEERSEIERVLSTFIRAYKRRIRDSEELLTELREEVQ